MQVNRDGLVSLIKNLAPGIANKEIIEQSTHVIFFDTHICSYNDEICVLMPFSCGFRGTVDADLLLKLVSKFEEEEIKLEVNPDKTHLDVFGDIDSVSLPLVLESVIFQHLGEVLKDVQSVGQWGELPKDFQAGIEMCAFSASTDRTLGAMCCLRVEGEDILSTDKHRIGWYVMESKMQNFLIEADHALKISRYKTLTKYSINKGWAHFRSDTGGISISCRIVQPPDEQLDLRPFFSVSEEAIRVKLPNDLIKRAELAGVLSEGKIAIERQVELKFEGSEVICSSQSEKGKASSRSKLERSLPFPINLKISPDLLIEILKFISSTVIIQRMDEEKGKAIFRTRGFSHCIVVRLS